MRLYTEGFEIGDVYFFDYIQGVTWQITATSPRTGNYAARNRLGSGPTLGYKNLPSSYSELYIRTCFKLEFISDTATIHEWRNTGTTLGKVTVDSGGKIKCYVGTSTLVATGSRSLSANTWYVLETHILIADSGGILECRIDGIYDAGYTGDTKPGADTTINRIAWTGWGSTANRNCDIDDIACNDTSGVVDNSWCGDGKVIILMPNDNGDSSQWIGSDGNNTDNYLLVDERPFDSDTTYVASGVSGSYDLYNLSDLSLTESDSILRVWPQYRAKKTSTDDMNIFVTIKSGGTRYTDTTASGILTQTYLGYDGEVRTTDPYTTSGWTLAGVNAVQIGPEVA